MRNFISLKPCPMCGGAVKRPGSGINVVFEAEPLVCSSCGFWIDLSYYKTWREAIEDWNKQPYIDGLKERIAELEGKIDQLTAHDATERQDDKWIPEVQE